MENICYNCFCDSLDENGVCTQCGFDGAKNREKYPLALPLGSILFGRYIVGRVLGQGGFGITYLAQDYQTKGRVAIKEFFPETMAMRTEKYTVSPYSGERGENYAYGLTKFLDEAKTMAEFIGNPNITRVDSYFEENGTGYFVMEYLEGGSFQEYIQSRGGQLSWEETMNVALPVMNALEAMHEKGIIHRDVAPDNIYLTRDGSVKLLDFGAARYSLGNVSHSLDVILKPGFAPKEQYIRKGKQGPFTDVYALGATIYYAITGTKPDESVERADEDNMPMPTTLGAKITDAQEAALLKALAVQPADRYQSMAEFRDALSAAKQHIQREKSDESQKSASYHEEEKQSSPDHEKKKQPPKKDSKKPLDPAIVKKAWAICIAAALLAGAFSLVRYGISYIRYSTAKRQYANGEYLAAYEGFTVLDSYLDSDKRAKEALYAHAGELMSREEYETAAENLSRLGTYLDSEEKLAVCNQQISAALYANACDLMDQGQYDSAIPIFEQLGDFQDSREKLQVYQSYIQYNLAQQLFEDGDYFSAFEVYTSLNAFNDSHDRANEAGYLYAQQCFREKDYPEAAAVFARLLDYEDSVEMYEESTYQAALQFQQEQKYDMAIVYFQDITDYKDASRRILDAQYQYALQLEAKKEWQEAASQFMQLNKYQDSRNHYLSNLYNYAEETLTNRKDLKYAVSLFQELGSYKDSKVRAQEAMYAYVLANKNSDNLTTYEYLKALKKARYSDSANLYDQLYRYRVVLTAVNTDPNDDRTILCSVSRATDYLRFSFRLEGGPPPDSGDTVILKSKSYWPDGSVRTASWELRDMKRGDGFDIYWDGDLYYNPTQGARGLMTVKIFIKGSNDSIGSGSIELT